MHVICVVCIIVLFHHTQGAVHCAQALAAGSALQAYHGVVGVVS